MRKVSKGVVFLHDNAPAHRTLATQKKLAYLGFQCLDHPPYSPDLALSDYHLFPELKKQLKCRHFSSDAEVIVAAEIWLDGQTSKFFCAACKRSSSRLRCVLSFVGSMLNKSLVLSL
jgi:histone-lysine N-methyltransferase SETMAR